MCTPRAASSAVNTPGASLITLLACASGEQCQVAALRWVPLPRFISSAVNTPGASLITLLACASGCESSNPSAIRTRLPASLRSHSQSRSLQSRLAGLWLRRVVAADSCSTLAIAIFGVCGLYTHTPGIVAKAVTSLFSLKPEPLSRALRSQERTGGTYRALQAGFATLVRATPCCGQSVLPLSIALPL